MRVMLGLLVQNANPPWCRSEMKIMGRPFTLRSCGVGHLGRNVAGGE